MSRHDEQRVADILAAVDAIGAHLERGNLNDELVFDAVRIRLLEIGEAVKAISPDLLATEPDMPWKQIAAMRDRLAHRYFDTSHAILAATVENDLDDLRAAAERLRNGRMISPRSGIWSGAHIAQSWGDDYRRPRALASR